MPAWAWLLPFVCALALLSIGIGRDWRLVHEDNGALHTTFARGHLDLGLARTRGQDVFSRPATDQRSFYGHHPSGTSVVLATGSLQALAGVIGSRQESVTVTVRRHGGRPRGRGPRATRGGTRSRAPRVRRCCSRCWWTSR